MDPHRPAGRSPSPGQPLRGYQLEDGPYRPQQPPLRIPMGPNAAGDRLAAQPTYSVENINSSYGHNEDYETHHPVSQHDYNYASHDYAISPEDHHDAYFTQPYQPSPPDEHFLTQYPSQEQRYYDDNDLDPILHSDDPYGPNPQLQPEYGDHDDGPPAKSTPSPAPIRRWKTVKEVQLFNGNLVLDCPIPPKLLNQVPHAQPPERDEFTHMRYSAATCDPSEFYEERFTLRQRLFAKPRHTELFIVVTMYNEDDFLFARTMIGVFKNIEHMCSRTNSKTWGKEAWKKIVVCVVSDGRAKINHRTRAVLAGLGVYQDGIAKQQVNGKDVTAHIYEYTTQVGLELKGKVVQLKPRGATPVQMLFCLKEKNQKKINSHRWFFQAFGRVLDPNICVLVDAGTKPGKDSIYHLWKAFDLEPMCGGACGEIKVMLSAGRKLLNPLVATQNFEYKMSNILDKPLESAFGFISVLPGAFSAYRYIALQNDKSGQGPLEKYFAGEKMHGANAGVFTANMYLAEDRILCFELVAKRNCRWILQYVKSATGETDVPDRMSEFIMQRRRWLNGSFFAAVYALAHFYQIYRSDHSFTRKLMFLVEFTYQTINMLFAWFAIGNFFLVFRILTTSLGGPDLLGTTGQILGVVFEWLYLATLLTCFVLAMGNRPQGSNKFYMTMVYFWCGIMVYLMFASVFITVKSIQTEVRDHSFNVADLFKNSIFFTLIVSLLSTYVLWFVISFLFFDPWHMFTSFIQYLLLTPTYINILNVYAFCNTHDITWGTKGDDKAEKLPSAHLKPGGKVEVNIPQDDGDLNAQYDTEMRRIATKAPKEVKLVSEVEHQEDYYKGFRSAVVLVWMFCNFALAAVVLSTAGLERIDLKNADTQRATIYMAVVLWSVAGLSAFRFFGAIWFLVVRMTPSPHRFISKPKAHQEPKPPSSLRKVQRATTSASWQQFAPTPRFSLSSANSKHEGPVPLSSSSSSSTSPLVSRTRPPVKLRRGEEIESSSENEPDTWLHNDREVEDEEMLMRHDDSTFDTRRRKRRRLFSIEPAPDRPRRSVTRRRDAIYISDDDEHDDNSNNNNNNNNQEGRTSPAPPSPSHALPPVTSTMSTRPAPRFLFPTPSQPSPSTPFPSHSIFLRPPPPTVADQRQSQTDQDPLPEAFSPHRRGGQKYVPDGLASSVREWVVEVSQEVVRDRQRREGGGGEGGGDVVRLRVEEVSGGGGNVVLVRGAGDGRRMMLMGCGRGGEVRTGVVVGVRAPVWEVEVLGEKWGVGVEWKVIGDG